MYSSVRIFRFKEIGSVFGFAFVATGLSFSGAWGAPAIDYNATAIRIAGNSLAFCGRPSEAGLSVCQTVDLATQSSTYVLVHPDPKQNITSISQFVPGRISNVAGMSDDGSWIGGSYFDANNMLHGFVFATATRSTKTIDLGPGSKHDATLGTSITAVDAASHGSNPAFAGYTGDNTCHRAYRFLAGALSRLGLQGACDPNVASISRTADVGGVVMGTRLFIAQQNAGAPLFKFMTSGDTLSIAALNTSDELAGTDLTTHAMFVYAGHTGAVRVLPAVPGAAFADSPPVIVTITDAIPKQGIRAVILATSALASPKDGNPSVSFVFDRGAWRRLRFSLAPLTAGDTIQRIAAAGMNNDGSVGGTFSECTGTDCSAGSVSYHGFRAVPSSP